VQLTKLRNNRTKKINLNQHGQEHKASTWGPLHVINTVLTMSMHAQKLIAAEERSKFTEMLQNTSND
jgi:hypothetical protein